MRLSYQTPSSLKTYRLSQDLENKAKLLALAGDDTRIRILCVLFQHPEVCVSDIAASVKMSISAISHHLQLLRDNGVVTTKRLGQNICYGLKQTKYTKQLRNLICG